MTHSDSSYMFLNRPRRFGKSVLISTLHSYFEGRKELFEGLAIDKLETEWTQYPVLHFDMSMARSVNKEQLERMLSFQLREYEKNYGRANEEETLNDRFSGLIRRVCQQTGKKVVVLIDEYDAPLLDVVHEEKNLPVLRGVRTPRGRVDMVMRTQTALYLVELKLDKSADAAMQQIDLKNYPERFALCGLPVIKVGINFNSGRRTLGDWKIT